MDKAITQALVRDLLNELAPEELDDLSAVFDTVYSSAEIRLDGAIERSGPGDGGLPFDASLVHATALSSAVWIVSSLIRAYRLRSSTEQRAALVRQLGRQAGSEERVRMLEDQVRGLLTAVDRLSDTLKSREAAVRLQLRDLIPTPSGSALSQDRTESRLPPLPPDRSKDGCSALDPPARDLLLLVVELGPVAGRFHLLGYRLVGSGFEGKPIHLRCPPHILRRAPGPYIAEILSGEADSPSAARIGTLGRFLADRLVPAELMKLLEKLSGGPATLQVLSEEPAVPWEILRLSPAPGGGGDASPFLADVFALSQWPGSGTPALQLGASKIALVAPRDSGLAAVDAEVALLEGRFGPRREVVRIPARYETVVEALTAGGFDIFHFTGHGVAPGENPDRWSLVLEDGESFSPIDLAIGIGGSAARPPLVFLNACHSARESWSLVGFGGLAASFLEAGAGAVVGANWAVSDEAARTFAEGFYGSFLAGIPIAETVRRARRRLRQQSPCDSTSLAYTVLAHPRARCTESSSRKRGNPTSQPGVLTDPG